MLDSPAMSFSIATQDTTGDSSLRCLFSSLSFDTSDSSCSSSSSLIILDNAYDACSDPLAQSCSPSGFNLICQSSYLNDVGACIQ